MVEREPLPILTEIWQPTLGWQPDGRQGEQFQRLYGEILAGNRQLNLTRLTEPLDFWEKHLWDSLAGVFASDLTARLAVGESLEVIDIGTGAGFPGIPVAIACPIWQVTLLDSTAKKIYFLKKLLKKINLKNAKVLLGRAEEIGRSRPHQSSYDLALIRAVGEPSTCAKYALPFIKVGGLTILYRGHWDEKNTAELEPTLKKMGGKIESIEGRVTPLSESVRHWIYLRKIMSSI